MFFIIMLECGRLFAKIYWAIFTDVVCCYHYYYNVFITLNISRVGTEKTRLIINYICLFWIVKQCVFPSKKNNQFIWEIIAIFCWPSWNINDLWSMFFCWMWFEYVCFTLVKWPSDNLVLRPKYLSERYKIDPSKRYSFSNCQQMAHEEKIFNETEIRDNQKKSANRIHTYMIETWDNFFSPKLLVFLSHYLLFVNGKSTPLIPSKSIFLLLTPCHLVPGRKTT
jgi:hypothetical protein